MAARTGRPKNSKLIKMTDEHRTKIASSSVLKCLIQHAEGVEGKEMSQSRVTAGLGLLKKVMSDMSNVVHSGDEDNPIAVTHIERTIVDPKNKNTDS